MNTNQDRQETNCLILKVFHSSWWEQELFLALCEPQRSFPLLLLGGCLWFFVSFPHTHILTCPQLQTQESPLQTSVTISVQPSLFQPSAPLTPASLAFQTLSSESSTWGDSLGCTWALLSCVPSWKLWRLLGGAFTGLFLYVSPLRNHWLSFAA